MEPETKPAGPAFRCRGCRHEQDEDWYGNPCPRCGRMFNVIQRRGSGTKGRSTFAALKVATIKYIPTGIKAFDDTIGGGIVKGSTLVLFGPPKTGKSTLLVQIAYGIAAAGHGVFYCSGEQSAADISIIVHRVGAQHENVILMDNEGDVERIIERAEQERPLLVIIDSLQTAYVDTPSGEGSSQQVKDVIGRITAVAKDLGIAFIVIGHIDKGGDMAGPETTRHLADTVVEFYPTWDDDDDDHDDSDPGVLRSLTCSMNRNANGPAAKSARFVMTMTGVQATEPPQPRRKKVGHRLRVVPTPDPKAE